MAGTQVPHSDKPEFAPTLRNIQDKAEVNDTATGLF